TPDGADFIPPRSLAGLDHSVSDALSRSVNGHHDAMNDSLNDSVNDSVNEAYAPQYSEPPASTQGDFPSLNHSLPEGKGREGNRERKGTPPTPRQSSGSPAVVQTGERAIEDRMTDAFLERYRSGNAYTQRQVRKVIADALTNGTTPDELWKALERLGSLSK